MESTHKNGPSLRIKATEKWMKKRKQKQISENEYLCSRVFTCSLFSGKTVQFSVAIYFQQSPLLYPFRQLHHLRCFQYVRFTFCTTRNLVLGRYSVSLELNSHIITYDSRFLPIAVSDSSARRGSVSC